MRIRFECHVPTPYPRHYLVKSTLAFTELKALLADQARDEVRATQAALAEAG
jgi:hypothetical protein